MNVNEIVEALNTNDIDYDRQFPLLVARGYDGNGCQALSGEIVERIGSIVTHGINNGFTGSMRAGIKELTQLAVKLSERNAERKVAKYRQAKTRIEHDIKYSQEGDTLLSVKSVVYPILDTSIHGAQVLIDAKAAGVSRETYLVQSVELLGKIRDTVSDSMDDSSKAAVGFARAIIWNVNEWRKITAQRMISEDTLAYLKTALSKAEEWHALRNSVRAKRDRVTEEDLKSLRLNWETDRMGRIAASEKVLRDIEIFHENLEQFRAKNEAYYNTEELEKEWADARKLIEELEGKQKDLVAQHLNGKLDKVSLARQGKRLDDRISDAKEKAANLDKDIGRKDQGRRGFVRISRILGLVYDTVVKHRDDMDPGMLTTIGKALDFEVMFSVMSGYASQVDPEKVFKIYRIGQEMDQSCLALQNEINDKLRAFDEENEQRWAQAVPRVQEEKQTQEQEADDAYADSLIAKFMKQEPQEEEEESPERSRLSTEDDK